MHQLDDEAIREGSYQFNVNFDIEALRQALDDDYVILLHDDTYL